MQQIINMLLAIVLIPPTTFLVSIFLEKEIRRRQYWLAISAPVAVVVWEIATFYHVPNSGESYVFPEWFMYVVAPYAGISLFGIWWAIRKTAWYISLIKRIFIFFFRFEIKRMGTSNGQFNKAENDLILRLEGVTWEDVCDDTETKHHFSNITWEDVREDDDDQPIIPGVTIGKKD